MVRVAPTGKPSIGPGGVDLPSEVNVIDEREGAPDGRLPV